jgi:uncharacterized membrane protein
VTAVPHERVGAHVDCRTMIAAIFGAKHIALYVIVILVIVAVVVMTMRRSRT